MPSRYPIAEQAILDWMKDGLDEPVYTETNESLEAEPCVRIQVHGGGAADITRSPLVEVCAFASGRGEALRLLDKADRRMLALAANGAPGRYADDVRLQFHPSVEPSGNSGIHQATATYVVDIRPQHI